MAGESNWLKTDLEEAGPGLAVVAAVQGLVLHLAVVAVPPGVAARGLAHEATAKTNPEAALHPPRIRSQSLGQGPAPDLAHLKKKMETKIAAKAVAEVAVVTKKEKMMIKSNLHILTRFISLKSIISLSIHSV